MYLTLDLVRCDPFTPRLGLVQGNGALLDKFHDDLHTIGFREPMDSFLIHPGVRRVHTAESHSHAPHSAHWPAGAATLSVRELICERGENKPGEGRRSKEEECKVYYLIVHGVGVSVAILTKSELLFVEATNMIGVTSAGEGRLNALASA